MIVNITNAESAYFRLESVQFNPTSSGFDPAYFDHNTSSENLEERFLAYFVKNSAFATSAGSIRYLASEFAYLLSRTEALISLGTIGRFAMEKDLKEIGIVVDFNLINEAETRLTVTTRFDI